MENVIDVLQERGFIEALSNVDMRQYLTKPATIYCGFDPTADGLHVGNLVPIMGLAWFQRFGHTPIAIVGGATGMIGDPSGKAAERQLLDEQTIASNLKGIERDLRALLDFRPEHKAQARILNNYDWFKNYSFIDVLRDIGKLFRLGPMLAKDSVRSRMNSEEGMSFTEFSYQLLQGYDFLHLFEKHNVSIQLGGSDQWGNIMAGIDLIRKVHAKSAYGITFPLLTRSDGQKFGKSEKGAIWLSAEKLSPYEFYQYFVRVEDADVINLMRMLTFMDMSAIKQYEKEMLQPHYVPRTAQKKLAEEITSLVHGSEVLQTAIRVTQGIAPGAQAALDCNLLEELAAHMPSCDLAMEQVVGIKLVDILVSSGLQSSKGEAKRLIRNGGVYLNDAKIEDENYTILQETLIENKFLLLSTGKKGYENTLTKH